VQHNTVTNQTFSRAFCASLNYDSNASSPKCILYAHLNEMWYIVQRRDVSLLLHMHVR